MSVRQLRLFLTAPLRKRVGQQRLLDWCFAAYWNLRTPLHRLTRFARPHLAPRIALVSMWDAGQAELGAITGPNKADYCRRHGYDWCPQTTGFVTDRPVAWSKIHFLRLLLPRYDWVMWSDVDSLITNPAIRLSDLVNQPADLLLTRDHIGANSGSFLIRNCAWSRAFLDEVWELALRPEHAATYGLWTDRMWENRAFLLLMLRSDVRRHSRFLPQRRLNSYHPEFTPAGPASAHQPGDFVLHLPGMENASRLQILRDYGRRFSGADNPAVAR